MGGLVAARTKRSYLITTFQTALTFPGHAVTLKIDATDPVEEQITNVAIGNGQYHGGGMWSCPVASITDGMFDVTVVRYLSLFDRLKAIRSLYNGALLTHPKVTAYRAKRIEATSKETVLIEIDGQRA